MKRITPQILQYREAARVLWNSFLREEDALGGGAISSDGALHDWDALKHLLFTAIVLRDTEIEGSDGASWGETAVLCRGRIPRVSSGSCPTLTRLR